MPAKTNEEEEPIHPLDETAREANRSAVDAREIMAEFGIWAAAQALSEHIRKRFPEEAWRAGYNAALDDFFRDEGVEKRFSIGARMRFREGAIDMMMGKV